MFSSIRFRAMLLLALGLLLAACGGEPAANMAEAQPSVAPSPTAPAAVAPSPTASAAVMPQPEVQPTPSATVEPVGAALSDEAPVSTEVTATIKTFVYRPAELRVAPGTRVLWTNEDDIGHSVTHGASPEPGGAFDSGLFGLGESFDFTFSEPGEYSYFCTRHPSMQGTVIVEAP